MNETTLSSPSKSRWPIAIGWFFLGTLLTSATGSLAGILASNVDRHVSSLIAELTVGAGIASAVVIACRLPKRARLMFIVGVVMPVLLAVAFVVWLIWAFAHSNFTF